MKRRRGRWDVSAHRVTAAAWWGLAVITIIAAAAACTGGGGDDKAGSGDGEQAGGGDEALATLEVIDQQIDVKTTDDTDFGPGETGMGLDVGDQIRSNTTGFGELGYFDGSWMRIEARATLTIEDLADTEDGEAVETSIDGGRLWSRAEKLTDSGDRFEVDTPVASASVRGTRFAIDCTVSWEAIAAEHGESGEDGSEDSAPEESCAFTVIEGTVTVTLPDGSEYTLTSAQQLLVADDGRVVGPIQLVPDELYANDWISKNLGVDLEK